MFINTKNSSLAAIISLSLLMASMPVKTEENNANKYAKKTAHCTWHVAKIVTGVLGCFAGTADLYSLLKCTRDKAKTIKRNMEACNISYENAKNEFNKYTRSAMLLAFAFLIPGTAAIKSGIDGLKKELDDSEKNPKEA